MYELTAPKVAPVYETKKDGAMWIVRSTSTGIVQFRSLRRINCTDWVTSNTPKETGTGGPDNG